MTRIVVGFPAPFAPRKSSISPLRTSKLTSVTARAGPYRFVRAARSQRQSENGCSVGIGVLWVIQGPLNLHEETSSLTGKSSDSRVAPLLRIQTEKVRDDALPSKRRSYRSRSAAPVAPFLKSG